MQDVASTIAFKRKQIESLAEIGNEAAAAATKRLNAEIAALDAQSPEGVAAAAAAPAAPAGIADLGSLVAQIEAGLAELRSRVAVLEVLSAPQG